jgi:hypothetical protein
MSGTEGLTVAGWLYERLSSDAQLASLVNGVFDTVAPPDAVLPFVVISEVGTPTDTNALPASRVLVTGEWQVRVTVEGMSWQPASAAVQRIDALLQGATASRTDGEVLGCTRVSTVKYPETSNGRHYRHLGGVYQIAAQ